MTKPRLAIILIKRLNKISNTVVDMYGYVIEPAITT